MSYFKDYYVYPDEPVGGPGVPVYYDNLVERPDGCYYDNRTKKVYWPDGTIKITSEAAL